MIVDELFEIINIVNIRIGTKHQPTYRIGRPVFHPPGRC